MSALSPSSRALSRHALPVPVLRIALLAGRSEGYDLGELGARLARRGHDIRVHDGGAIGAVARNVLHRADVAIIGAADAPAIPLLRARGTALAAVLTGGGATVRRHGPGAAERFAIRDADALVADLQLVADRVAAQGLPVTLIRPGADRVRARGTDRITGAGLLPGAYHLVTGDDGLDLALRAHRRSAAALPLVIVGGRAQSAVPLGRRVRVFAGPADSGLAAQLRAHALTSLHPRRSPGGDPALPSAMASGIAILAADTPANRELAGTAGFYATDDEALARHLEDAERYPQRFRDIGDLMAERAAARFDWDRAAEAWEALAARLSRGYSSRGMSGARGIVTA